MRDSPEALIKKEKVDAADMLIARRYVYSSSKITNDKKEYFPEHI